MHTMDKETAITEARQRFKAWRCRPDSCSVPPLNPQRTSFDSELIVSPHRLAIPFSGGHCMRSYHLSRKKLTKEQKNVHLRGPVSVCLSEQKEKPRSYAGLFQRGHKRGRERPCLMVDEALGPRQITHHSTLAILRQSHFRFYAPQIQFASATPSPVRNLNTSNTRSNVALLSRTRASRY